MAKLLNHIIRFLLFFVTISSFLYAADQFKKLTLEERANALEMFFNYEIREENLQAEIERIAENTKNPDILKEIFAALGDDPVLIAEVYIRNVFAQRILENIYYNDDKFQKTLRDQVKNEVKNIKYASELKNLSGKCLETTVKVKKGGPPEKSVVKYTREEFENFINNLFHKFSSIDERNYKRNSSIEIGKISKIIEDREGIRVIGVLDKGTDFIKICTVFWEKKTFYKWWDEIEKEIPSSLNIKSGNFKIPSLRNGSCKDDTWYNLPGPPDERFNCASGSYRGAGLYGAAYQTN